MAHVFYQYLGLISPESEATIPSLAELLKTDFGRYNADIVVRTEAARIEVIISGYKFQIFLNEESHVQEESEEIAAISELDYADNPIDKAELAKCKKRFELSGEPDQNMDYFNDSLTILAAMEEVGGVTIIMLN